MMRPEARELLGESLFDLYWSGVREEHHRKLTDIVISTAQVKHRITGPAQLSAVLSVVMGHIGARHVWMGKVEGQQVQEQLSVGERGVDPTLPLAPAFVRCLQGETIIFTDLQQVPEFAALRSVRDGDARSGLCVVLQRDFGQWLLLWTHPDPHAFGAAAREQIRRIQPMLAQSVCAETFGANQTPSTPTEPVPAGMAGGASVVRGSVVGRASRPWLPPGLALNDRYEIRSRIGRGGYAMVYEAWDRDAGRTVAVKVLNRFDDAVGGARTTETVLRFQREAAVMRKIRHPSIVSVLDYDVTTEGQPFMVMERLNGHDLGRELKRFGPMAPERLFPLMIDALRGLGAAHTLDIVHRDLKPSNLFLSRSDADDEAIRILDFGVASELDESNLTRSGFRVGTARYMAPELINQSGVFPASDVYQMALILVEALEGRPVVAAKDPMQCMFVHSNGHLELPSRVKSGPLGFILERALCVYHDQRYDNGPDFADALSRVPPDSVPPPAMLG